jgi:hypothetical protein
MEHLISLSTSLSVRRFAATAVALMIVALVVSIFATDAISGPIEMKTVLKDHVVLVVACVQLL